MLFAHEETRFSVNRRRFRKRIVAIATCMEEKCVVGNFTCFLVRDFPFGLESSFSFGVGVFLSGLLGEFNDVVGGMKIAWRMKV